MEKTFIMVKPDGVQRARIGEIIKRLENKGLFLKGLKMVKPDRSVIEKHYAQYSEKHFFDALVKYMISGPIVAMVWEGKDAVVAGRMLIVGSLGVDPLTLKPGTIRGDFAVDIGRKIVHGTVVHGSDTIESAREEIALWFPEGVVSWESSLQSWIHE